MREDGNVRVDVGVGPRLFFDLRNKLPTGKPCNAVFVSLEKEERIRQISAVTKTNNQTTTRRGKVLFSLLTSRFPRLVPFCLFIMNRQFSGPCRFLVHCSLSLSLSLSLSHSLTLLLFSYLLAPKRGKERKRKESVREGTRHFD